MKSSAFDYREQIVSFAQCWRWFRIDNLLIEKNTKYFSEKSQLHGEYLERKKNKHSSLEAINKADSFFLKE